MQQLYNYQNIICKQPINHLYKKNYRYFYEMFVLKWFYKCFVCYRVVDLIKSCLLCICRVYFLELYLKTFIRIFLSDYDFVFIGILFIYLFIYLFTLLFIQFAYLFYLFIRHISEIYLSKIYQVIFLRMLYILWFTNMIVLSLRYIVYRKEQSTNRGKSR